MLNTLKKSCFYEMDINGKQYDAHIFKCENKTIYYRQGKVTPKYNGVFVAFWKKDINTNVPFDEQDDFNYLLVKNFDDKYWLFTKEDLNRLGILNGKKKGKLGFRLDSDNSEKNSKYIDLLYTKKEVIKIMGL